MPKTKLFIAKILNQIKQKPTFLILGIIFYIIFNSIWGFIAALFLGTFLLFAMYQWDSRVFIGFGLLFLLATPFYLLQRKELMAEEMAVYAYYFLFLGVILQLIEYIREERQLTFWQKLKRYLGLK